MACRHGAAATRQTDAHAHAPAVHTCLDGQRMALLTRTAPRGRSMAVSIAAIADIPAVIGMPNEWLGAVLDSTRSNRRGRVFIGGDETVAVSE